MLSDNLTLTKKAGGVLAEALAQRQPGDRLTITLEATLVENLAERAKFDVNLVDSVGGVSSAAGLNNGEDDDETTPESSVLADSVLGVMAKKPK
jgi:hypothetical protein